MIYVLWYQDILKPMHIFFSTKMTEYHVLQMENGFDELCKIKLIFRLLKGCLLRHKLIKLIRFIMCLVVV